MTWTLHHIVAMCRVCAWSDEYHGTLAAVGRGVQRRAREHSAREGHYVQVERGQHAHYGLPDDPAGGER